MFLSELKKSFLEIDRIDKWFMLIIFFSVLFDIVTTFIGIEVYGMSEQNPKAIFIFNQVKYPYNYIVNFILFGTAYILGYKIMSTFNKLSNIVFLRILIGGGFVLAYSMLGWVPNLLVIIWKFV